MTFGRKLKRLMRLNDLTNRSLAEKLGDVGKSTVSNWANDLTYPDLDVVRKLVNIFGVSADYLVLDELENPESADGLTADERMVVRMMHKHGLDAETAILGLNWAAERKPAGPLPGAANVRRRKRDDPEMGQKGAG